MLTVTEAQLATAQEGRKQEFHNRLKSTVQKMLVGNMDDVALRTYMSTLSRKGVEDLALVLNGQLKQLADAVQNQK